MRDVATPFFPDSVDGGVLADELLRFMAWAARQAPALECEHTGAVDPGLDAYTAYVIARSEGRIATPPAACGHLLRERLQAVRGTAHTDPAHRAAWARCFVAELLWYIDGYCGWGDFMRQLHAEERAIETICRLALAHMPPDAGTYAACVRHYRDCFLRGLDAALARY